MKDVYKNIAESARAKKRLLAILIDPDKFSLNNTKGFIGKVNDSMATHIFVGGSKVEDFQTEYLVEEIKKYTQLPVILFPGDTNQITAKADGILFLSLISGNNPDYLIKKHIDAVPLLKKSNLEIIPTGYILIQNGKVTMVEKVTRTNPLSKEDVKRICDTAKAGEYLGMQMIYLEAGSGATDAVSMEIISKVKDEVNIPLIVGGGIKSKGQIYDAYKAGADLVVIGTILEEDESFFDEICI